MYSRKVVLLSLLISVPFILEAGELDSPEEEDLEVSASLRSTVGCSDAEDEIVKKLQIGEEDPKRCGFTLQVIDVDVEFHFAELLKATVNVSANEEGGEIGEAFLTTTLPYPIAIKGGYFLTGFGYFNTSEDDFSSLSWLDQPIISTRLLGSDGLKGIGAQLGWTLPLSWRSQLQLGVQKANQESALSFLGKSELEWEEEEEPEFEGVGGRPTVHHDASGFSDLLYSLRWQNQWQFDNLSLTWGISGLFGPNNTGEQTKTRIYGTDFVLQWPTHQLVWQTEFMYRHYSAAAYSDEQMTLPADTLKDWGFYTQANYHFALQWSTGLRYEYATGIGESLEEGRSSDPLRSSRLRLSPLLTWYPHESTRVLLQYNYDDADFLQDKAHSVWLGVEITADSLLK